MTDRRVALEVGVQRGRGEAAGADVGAGDSRGRPREEPDAAARQRFERALHGAPAGPLSAALAGPLALFGGVAVTGPLADAGAQATAAAAPDWNRLAEGVARLLVGDGRSGRRQVRIDLRNDALPDTTVEIVEHGGALLVAFTCAAERARRLLAEGADRIAATLAERLSRPIVVRVQSDDPEDPAPVEARAGAVG
jgi:hypothetical protein